MTTEQKVKEFIAANPHRSMVDEREFIRELTLPWMDKPQWWLRKNLTKRERWFVEYIRKLDEDDG